MTQLLYVALILVIVGTFGCGKQRDLGATIGKNPPAEQATPPVDAPLASGAPTPPAVFVPGNGPANLPAPVPQPPLPVVPLRPPPSCLANAIGTQPTSEIDQAGVATGEGNRARFRVEASILGAIFQVESDPSEFAGAQVAALAGAAEITGLIRAPGSHVIRFVVTDPTTGLRGRCAASTTVAGYGIATQNIFRFRGPSGSNSYGGGFYVNDFFYTNDVVNQGASLSNVYGYSLTGVGFKTYVKATNACNVPITQCQTCSGGYCLHFVDNSTSCSNSQYLGTIGYGCASAKSANAFNPGAVDLLEYRGPNSHLVTLSSAEGAQASGWHYYQTLGFVAPQ